MIGLRAQADLLFVDADPESTFSADPKLRYSVRTTDGSESVTRTLSLIGEFEDLEENGSDLPSSALRAADTPDEITRYTKAQKHLSSFENIASESVA